MPDMPLSETVGRKGILPPEQILREAPKLNVGITTGFTVTLKLVVVAH